MSLTAIEEGFKKQLHPFDLSPTALDSIKQAFPEFRPKREGAKIGSQTSSKGLKISILAELLKEKIKTLSEN